MEITYKQSLFNGAPNDIVSLQWWPILVTKDSTNNTHDVIRLHLKCVCTGADTRFRLLGKRTSPFKSAGASFQSTTGSWGVRISGNNAGYTKFRGSVKGTGYPLHSPDSPSLPLPCITVCHHVSTGLYHSHGPLQVFGQWWWTTTGPLQYYINDVYLWC